MGLTEIGKKKDSGDRRGRPNPHSILPSTASLPPAAGQTCLEECVTGEEIIPVDGRNIEVYCIMIRTNLLNYYQIWCLELNS